MRVGTLAITDHDTTAAFRRREKKFRVPGLALNLILVSRFQPSGKTMRFIVGLNIDIAHPMMCDFLGATTERRKQAPDCRTTGRRISPARGKGR
jgi:predicted metal-dependent phosphoesterase TrpH